MRMSRHNSAIGVILRRLVFAAGVLAATCDPAASTALPVSYDIVYVRQPRFGNTTNTTWAEVAHPASIDPGADLMLLHPDGSEELLVEGGVGAVVDPFVSFDGQWVYYSLFYDMRPSAINSQRGLPYLGSDIFRIHLQSRQIEQLTFGEFTPNTGAGHFDESNPLNPPGQFDRLGYGILNLGPAPVAGGKIVFTSNRNGFVPPQGLTNPTLQLFVMDEDGGNVTQIAPMNIGSALHPTPLRDGRIMFSSLETQGLRDGRIWGIWSIYPDGRHWAPVVSAFRSGQAFHFMTQLSNEDLVVVDYYNLNNNGFGALYRLPVGPPAGTPAFYSAFPDENPSIQQTVGGGFPYPFSMSFTPWGMHSITPFTHGNDEAAPIGAGGVRVGKLTHPSGAPNNDLLVVWTPGPANDLNRPVTDPRYDAGLYLIPNGGVVSSPSGLILLKNDPAYNEAWPRAVVPYAAVHGVAQPEILPWLPNDGTKHGELPAGTPYGLVGTSSFYKRESFPGFVRPWADTFDGLDAFNTTENEQSSNWNWQGSDAGKYDDGDIWAVRIVAMEPGTHRSYGPNGGPSGGQLFFSHAHERLRILGEIPLRKLDSNGDPILDPEGNPDTSFLARIPADTPFTFQTLDRNGLLLNMAQTWHQVRPGEARYDCGGCHAHSQQPLDFHRTAAARPDYEVVDLVHSTPLLSKDAQGEPDLRIENSSLVDVEFYRDIRPLLQRSCVPCHTKQDANPPGRLVLDDYAFYESSLPGDYVRLANDSGARWGYPPLVRVGNPVWRQTNASRYVRAFQSRRSLLVWKIFGARLDGWSNADHPTESVPGDATTLPAGATINESDLDFTGQIMPPPGSGVPPLSEDEKMTIARWIDLGAPINSGNQGNTAYGWFLDDLRPTLALSSPRPGRNDGALGEIRIGVADTNSGVDLDSLSVSADFAVAGRDPGDELADLAQPAGDGIYVISLGEPITDLPAAELHVEIADQQGNVTRVARRFSVAAPGVPSPTPTATATATSLSMPTPTSTLLPTATASPTRSLPPTSTPTFGPAVHLWLVERIVARPGMPLDVPVMLQPHSSVEAFDLVFHYDPAIVSATSVQTTRLSQECAVASNIDEPGLLHVAGACSQPLMGEGPVVVLRFAVLGECRQTSDLGVDRCQLNEGETPCVPHDARVQIPCDVRGRTLYYRGERPVEGAQIEVVGAMMDGAESDTVGDYAVSYLDEQGWSLVPSKLGAFNGAVSALDAAYVLQAVVGSRTFDDAQRFACDASGNGSLSALDAARILQVVVGLRDRLPIAELCGSDWAFDPTAQQGALVHPHIAAGACVAGSISYPDVSGNLSSQDFRALLFGDCTGNWQPADAQLSTSQGTRRDAVRLGRLRRAGTRRLRVPISVRSAAPFNALRVELGFDPRQLRLRRVFATGEGRGGAVRSQYRTDGIATIALASPGAVRGSGAVLVAELERVAPGARTGVVRVLSSRLDEE